MECFFNELSAKTVDSVVDAQGVMQLFVQTVAGAAEFGLHPLRLYENKPSLFDYLLTPQYRIENWLKDKAVDTALKDRFRLIVTDSPLIKESEPQFEPFQNSLFVFHNEVDYDCFGLGGAYLFGSAAVSWLTNPIWDATELVVFKHFSDENNEFKCENVSVKHFSKPEHLPELKIWLDTIRLQSLETGRQLWEQRAALFPNLILCGDVEKQLENLGESKYLPQIIDRLKVLNGFCSDWQTGDFDLTALNTQTNLNVSGESEQTMKKYGSHRRFKLPNGSRELFELHIKTGDLRFHFYPDVRTCCVYMGYIGKHLPTIKFK